jgi:hypothetical protein
MGGVFVSATIAATSGVPGHESGLASGLLTTSQQIGGAVGLAVLTGVATSATANYLHGLPSHPSHAVMNAATVHGFHEGYLVASTFGIAASLLATLVIRNQRPPADAGSIAAAPSV